MSKHLFNFRLSVLDLKDNVSNAIYKNFKSALCEEFQEEGLDKVLNALGSALKI